MMNVNLEEQIVLFKDLRNIASKRCNFCDGIDYDLKKARDRIRCFLPAIDSENFTVDLIKFKDLVKELLSVLVKNPLWGGRKIIVDELLEDDKKIKTLNQLLLNGELKAISEYLNVSQQDAEAIAFLFRQALLPYISLIGQNLVDAIGDWDKGYCPICGMNPNIGIIQKNGTLKLSCSFCNQSWNYPRLKCPFCGNDANDRLGYLQVEGDIAHRIAYCEGCKGYMKMVDSRELEREVDAEEEYLRTLHLDLLAQGRGFIVKIRP
jgi:FdhE protein